MTLEVNDMRSKALGITGKAGDAGFTTANSVTNGTDDVKNEAALISPLKKMMLKQSQFLIKQLRPFPASVLN